MRRAGNGDLWIIGLLVFILPIIVFCIFVLPQIIAPDRSTESLNDIAVAKDRMQAEDNRIKLQNDIRTTLIQAVGGTFFLLTAFFTWRQTRTSQRQLEVNQRQLELTQEQMEHTAAATQDQLEVNQKQLRLAQKQLDQNAVATQKQMALTREQLENSSTATQEQLRLTRQEQTAGLFTRAIDQLGNQTDGMKNIEVRIGGIYALERIAKQSPEDRAVVAEVLTAYVRGQSPWPPREGSPYPASHSIERLPSLRIRVPDVQTALTVLGRLVPDGERPLRYDLSRADLRRASLIGGNFQDAEFQESNLESADLIGANCKYADFGSLFESGVDPDSIEELRESEGANLKGAHLGGADLENADFFETNLENAYLANANLKRAKLIGTRLINTELSGADLREAIISQAYLQDVQTDEGTKWPEGFHTQAQATTDEVADSD